MELEKERHKDEGIGVVGIEDDSPTLGSMVGAQSEMSSHYNGREGSSKILYSHSIQDQQSSSSDQIASENSFLEHVANWDREAASRSHSSQQGFPSASASGSGYGHDYGHGYGYGWNQNDTHPYGHRITSGENKVRNSRLISGGGRFGVSPPPPPGPPPTAPPPLPPSSSSSSHASSSRSRSSTLFQHNSPPSKLTSLNRPNRLPPIAPPPTSALPPIPPSNPTESASPTRPNHARQGSNYSILSESTSHSKRNKGKNRQSDSSSPSISPNSPSGPNISPRTSSLQSSMSKPSDTPSSPLTQEYFPEHQSQTPSSYSHSSQTLSSLGTPLPAHHLPPSRRDVRQPPRTPSRHLLQSALDLAQKAVEMDRNNDVLGALAAYREAVSRLKAVMERVGVDPEREGSSRRRGGGRSEEEGRTLKGIHDAYVARIELLSSYENGPASPATADVNAIASASTATLTPTRPATNGRTFSAVGDLTPRPSPEDSTHQGIGDYMLADNQSEDFVTPQRGHATSEENRLPQLRDEQQKRSSTLAVRGLNINLPSDSLHPDEGEATSADSAEKQNVPGSARSSHNSASTSGSPVIPIRRTSASHLGIGLGRPVGPSIDPGSPTPSTKRQIVEGGMEMLTGTPGHGHGHDSPETQMNGGPSRFIPGIPLTPGSKRSSLRSRDDDRPLPPLPQSVLSDAQGQPMITSRHASLTGASFPIRGEREVLVNTTTADGMISRRRSAKPDSAQTPSSSGHGPDHGHRQQPSISSTSELGSEASSPALPSGVSVSRRSISSTNSAASVFGQRVRSRSRSISGRTASFQGEEDELPPLPTEHRRPSVQYNQSRKLSISTEYSNGLAPPSSVQSHITASSPQSISRSFTSSLISPIPEPQPPEIAHRPFHLLRIFHSSMDPNGSGAYLTNAIHIAPYIWRPSTFVNNGNSKSGSSRNFKIPQQDTKARYIETLLLHLEIVRSAGIPLLDGIREYKYGTVNKAVLPPPRAGEGMILRAAEEFVHALDGLDEEMDQTHKAWSKAGVVNVGWKGKKAKENNKSWGSRITRGVDKITSGKSNDTVDKYVELLGHLCYSIQTLNDHLLNFTGPCTPAYHTLPHRTYSAVESRVSSSAEFVAGVIIPFVMDEFKFFFLRYLKGGLKYTEG